MAKFSPEGALTPVSVTWDSDHKYEVDKVLDVRQAASLKVGGQGMRYTCRIEGKEKYLWLEAGKWFVEAKE